MASIYEPEWDAERDEPPYRWRRARLGRQTGARALGASLFELPPGAASFPLHIHYANEEMLVVVAGRATLQTLSWSRELGGGRSRRWRGRGSWFPMRWCPARPAAPVRTAGRTAPTSRCACSSSRR